MISINCFELRILNNQEIHKMMEFIQWICINYSIIINFFNFI